MSSFRWAEHFRGRSLEFEAMRMKRASSLLIITLLLSITVYAQTPTAPAPAAPPKPAAQSPAPSAGAPVGASKIAVIDFERAVTGTSDGKKAAEQFQG